MPAPAGDYSALAANGKVLFWLEQEPGADDKQQLMALEIVRNDPKPAKIVEEVTSFELSRDGKTLLVRKEDDLYVFDAGARPRASSTRRKLDLSGWSFPLDPREDWRQIFVEPGASSATTSTTRACTASTGRPFSTSTSPSSIASRPATSCPTCIG